MLSTKLFRHIGLAALLCTTTAFASAQLPQVLAQLDKAAAGFTTAQANVRYDNYTSLVHDHDIQTGKLFIERSAHGEQMGATFAEAGSSTPSRIVSYDGGKLEMYTPGTNTVDVFSAGNNQAKYESFLTLGFGGSGKQLAANWTITDLGKDTINGVSCEKLDLVGKDASVRQMFTHVTLWIDPLRGVSLRQIFFQPNKDTRTADYTDIVLGKKIDRKAFSIPKNAVINRH